MAGSGVCVGGGLGGYHQGIEHGSFAELTEWNAELFAGSREWNADNADWADGGGFVR